MSENTSNTIENEQDKNTNNKAKAKSTKLKSTNTRKATIGDFEVVE